MNQGVLTPWMNLHQHIKLMNVLVYYFYCNLHVYQAPLDIIKPRSDRRFYYMLQHSSKEFYSSVTGISTQHGHKQPYPSINKWVKHPLPLLCIDMTDRYTPLTAKQGLFGQLLNTVRPNLVSRIIESNRIVAQIRIYSSMNIKN